MGGESPFFVTARLLAARPETRNKHISKSLYQFSPRRVFLKLAVILLIHMRYQIFHLRVKVSAVNNKQAFRRQGCCRSGLGACYEVSGISKKQAAALSAAAWTKKASCGERGFV